MARLIINNKGIATVLAISIKCASISPAGKTGCVHALRHPSRTVTDYRNITGHCAMGQRGRITEAVNPAAAG